jgi:hypothetical protein
LNRSAFAEATGATSKALHREGFAFLGTQFLDQIGGLLEGQHGERLKF